MVRPLLAWVFISGGVDVARKPQPRAQAAAPIIDSMLALFPVPGVDRVAMVRANAVLQVVAGGTMAIGVWPRLSALALAGSLIPTTIGGHPFWTIEDPAQRAQQRTHFNKNLAILGGLLLVAAG
ncbi:MAG TPA: DoxX family protein [Candidatus Dormibacteraeota bacterium]|nr:DoxX family protein [Candidatus Dormibacteraeota bacterium]